MNPFGGAIAGGVLGLILAAAVPGGRGGQDQAPIGYLSGDRIVAMAESIDASVASFVPSPAALASFVALVDPVHVRMFFRASRPTDLSLAAKLARTIDATANPALSAEFIGVSEDLAEPKGPIADNGITKAPELIVYWMSVEVGRMHPEGEVLIEDELAGFIHQARAQIAEEMLRDNSFFRNTFHSDLPLACKRCHGPR